MLYLMYFIPHPEGKWNQSSSEQSMSLGWQAFCEWKIDSKLDNLASITVKLPKENIVVPGIYYFIFQRLAGKESSSMKLSTSNEFTI
jgi:hypothetical protein